MHLPAVIGHRGAAATAPENTLAGFRAAAALGCQWVEFDVRLSADGVPVVIHDATLDRTTDACGPVAARTASELSHVDAGRWFGPQFSGQSVPTLAEAMALISSLGLGANVEIKAEDDAAAAATARACAPILREHWWRSAGGLLLSSFTEAALAEAATAMPEVPRGLLVEQLGTDTGRKAHVLGCSSVHVSWRRLRGDMVAAIKALGLPVLAYTVNDRHLAGRLWALGVDAVFSDCPERLPTQA